MFIRKLSGALALLCFCASVLAAGSTVNPAAPANGASLSSAPVRNNFAAAYSDLNNLFGQSNGSTAPSSPVLGQLWLNTGGAPYILNEYDGGSWVQLGTLNAGTHAWNVPASQVSGLGAGVVTALGSAVSGSGSLCLTSSCVMTAPNIGAATATTVNGNTITTSSGTLTLAAGKTHTVNNSITLAGTDSTTMTFPATSATIARTDAAQTFSGVQTFTGNISNAATPGTQISAGYFLQTGNATSGQGGNVRFVNDAGTSAWLTGILGSAGATNFSIYDIVHGASRLTVNSSTGDVIIGTSTDDGINALQVAGGFKAGARSTLATARAVGSGSATVTLGANIASTAVPANTASGAFTVTLAAPSGDGERRRVCFANATGTITWAVTTPATATAGLPATVPAGGCVEMVYNSVAGSPSNSAASTWYIY